MWERGARHNPASFRYRYYMDHRPILPQDPTLGFLRKSYNVYQNVYFTFNVAKGKNKIIFSNNIPVNDREVLKELTSYDQTLRKNFKFFSLISTIFLSGFFFENVNFQKNYLKRFLAIGAIFFGVHTVIHRIYLNHFNDLTSYYYYKYQHLFVDSLEEVVDNRRKFFQLDTSSYYRDTAETIRHSAHHPADKNHHDHDTSTYYGPYPYDDHQNLEVVQEIDRKFKEGKSKFDDPENERILGEKLDITRNIRTLPSADDFKNLK